MKKIVTVCWSTTVEMDLPEDATTESVNNAVPLEAAVMLEAWQQVQMGGV